MQDDRASKWQVESQMITSGGAVVFLIIASGSLLLLFFFLDKAFYVILVSLPKPFCLPNGHKGNQLLGQCSCSDLLGGISAQKSMAVISGGAALASMSAGTSSSCPKCTVCCVLASSGKFFCVDIMKISILMADIMQLLCRWLYLVWVPYKHLQLL